MASPWRDGLDKSCLSIETWSSLFYWDVRELAEYSGGATVGRNGGVSGGRLVVVLKSWVDDALPSSPGEEALEPLRRGRVLPLMVFYVARLFEILRVESRPYL